jgi:hypothetical protein
MMVNFSSTNQHNDYLNLIDIRESVCVCVGVIFDDSSFIGEEIHFGEISFKVYTFLLGSAKPQGHLYSGYVSTFK